MTSEWAQSLSKLYMLDMYIHLYNWKGFWIMVHNAWQWTGNPINIWRDL